MIIKVMERHFEVARIHRVGNPLIKTVYCLEVVSKRTGRRIHGYDETFSRLADAVQFLKELDFNNAE